MIIYAYVARYSCFFHPPTKLIPKSKYPFTIYVYTLHMRIRCHTHVCAKTLNSIRIAAAAAWFG